MIETTNHSWKRVPDVLLQDARLRLSDVAVFACLLDLCKDTLRISVSCKEIASRTNRSRKTVMRSLTMLENYGYIERKTVSGGISTYILAEIVPAEKKRKRSIKNTAPDGELAEQSESPKPERRYGQYQHIELTDTEKLTLEQIFGRKAVGEYIQKIDDYCELYGKSYENYYLAIKKWIDEDKRKYPKQFDKQKNVLSEEKLAGYLSLVNRFKDD